MGSGRQQSEELGPRCPPASSQTWASPPGHPAALGRSHGRAEGPQCVVLCRAGPRCCPKPGQRRLLAFGCASPTLRGFPAPFCRRMTGFWGACLLFSVLRVSPLRSLVTSQQLQALRPPRASRPGAERRAAPRHTPAPVRQSSANPRRLRSTATPWPRKPLLCPWGPVSSPASFPPIFAPKRSEAPEQLPSQPAPGSVTPGHGQRATSLPPSSVPARAHEQRRDRKASQKASEDRREPSPGSAGPGDKPFGDSVGREVATAAATARRLRPPARCRGEEVCRADGVRAPRGSVASRKRCGWRRAPKFAGPGGKLAGGRFPLAPWGRGSGGGAGDAGAPVSLSCAPAPGWGIPGAPRAQGSALCLPKFIPAARFLHEPGPAGSWRGR